MPGGCCRTRICGSGGYFEKAQHTPESAMGTREYISRGWRISNAEVAIRGPAPTLGADNRHILSGLLGLPDKTITDLEKAEAVGSTLLGASEPASVPLERQVELGWTVDYDSDYRRHLSSDSYRRRQLPLAVLPRATADGIGERP